MKRDFDTEYKRLNTAQKKAVDTVEGPVMVIAGPGTGKTQVLAMRVANILKKTQARPSNILCLTFSNSGVTAMKERLRELIGSDGYGVTVNTVHSFADSIIRRHPIVFSEWAAGTQLSDLEKHKILEKIIDSTTSNSALINAKNPYDRISGILSRISDCKREGKTLKDLKNAAKEYAVQMEGKSKQGTKLHEKNLLSAKKFSDFVHIYERYSEILREKSLYDYDDMILTVISALQSEDWLISGLQERYQYILVDESQDLNGAQWKLIDILTQATGRDDYPNFFVVGDDDQAIFRFQGANMEHLLSFHNRFPSAPVIVLEENYRSTQPILNAAQNLISKNEERLVGRIPNLSKNLLSKISQNGIEPLLLRCASDAAEPWLIADLVQERIERGVTPSEIAVLVQTNRELRPIYDVLRARQIPVVLYGKEDLLSHSIVLQILTILRYILSGSDDNFIHAISCPSFGCHAADISRIISLSREQKTSFSDTLLSLEDEGLTLFKKDVVLLARNILLDLRLRESSRTVLDTVEHVIRESGISSNASSFDPVDLAVVEEFFRYVKERCISNPSLSLSHFLRDIDFYENESFSQVRLTYQVPHLVSDGVQLLTAHQSKGLEFETVILSSFRDGHWDERRNPSSLSLPEDLLFGWNSDQKKYEKSQDERRVAYVAMTRAKNELLMICPREFSVGERVKSVSPSAFFAEAGSIKEIDRALIDAEKASLLLFPSKSVSDAELKAYLLDRISKFSLSPTSLSRFLENPELFMRIDLLSQPQEFSEQSQRSLGYGSAVHWALKKWAEVRQSGSCMPLENFLAAFEWHLSEKSVLTNQQRKDLLSQGKRDLPKYFEQKLVNSSPFIHSIERDLYGRIGDIPLKGKIDRIDLFSSTSGDAVVIDFKTGSPKTPSQIRGGVEQGYVSRSGTEGANFRQLVFYSLLLQMSDPLLTPQVFRLEFVGERGEDPVSKDFSVSESEKDDLQKLISQVWSKITALDFTPIQ